MNRTYTALGVLLIVAALTLPATAVAEGAQLDGDSLEQGE